MISQEMVKTAYQLILGREPEDQTVIEYHQQHESVEGLRTTLLECDEFLRSFKLMHDRLPYVPTDQVMPPRAAIDLPEDDETLKRMFDQSARTWRRLGEERPYHSVMGLDQFLPDTYEQNAGEFDETGRIDLTLIDMALEHLPDREAITGGLCIEIGCGVCRIAIPLAERFERILGVDISPTHLALAEEALERTGVTNVSLQQVGMVDDYAALPPAQFILSRFVLHHNPPPVQVAILRRALSRLASPGAVMIQVVTHIDNYRFDAAEYLSVPRNDQETHAVPQHAVFALFREAGLRIIEVQRDDTAADEPWLRSFVFLAYRD